MKYQEPLRDTIKRSIEQVKDSDQDHIYTGDGPDNRYSKDQVNYGKGHADAHCGICTHYDKPKEDACELVKGTIHTEMWCEKYEHNG